MAISVKQNIRFGVRASTGHRAATWKIWTPGGQKNDVYLACRELNGELKASLHESGKWHVSFTPSFYESSFADESTKPHTRFATMWDRPKEIAPGYTLAFRIVVPWNSATVEPEEELEDIVWVSSAPKGHQHEFAIFISLQTCVVTDWPGKNGMNSKLVGSFLLAGGETVWIIYTTHSLTIPAKTSYPMQLLKGVDASALQEPGLRAIAIGTESDGSRVMYDCAVSTK